MLLILLEVSVRATHWYTRVTACSQVLGSISESNLLVDNSHGLQPQSYFHATYSARSISESDSLIDQSLGLMLKGYFRATYSAGSISESDSLVDESLF